MLTLHHPKGLLVASVWGQSSFSDMNLANLSNLLMWQKCLVFATGTSDWAQNVLI